MTCTICGAPTYPQTRQDVTVLGPDIVLVHDRGVVRYGQDTYYARPPGTAILLVGYMLGLVFGIGVTALLWWAW